MFDMRYVTAFPSEFDPALGLHNAHVAKLNQHDFETFLEQFEKETMNVPRRTLPPDSMCAPYGVHDIE